MKSLWSDTVQFPSYPSLTEDKKTEVAIIGGGMTGILTAYLLHKKGCGVIVLEADTVAGGQTKNTTAKITSQHGLKYQKLIKDFGEEKARTYAMANEQAIWMYQKITEETGADCSFERLPAYLYTLDKKEMLVQEAEAAALLGISTAQTRNTTLPFEVAGALRFENQAQFHPLKFLNALLPGLEVYEHTRVNKAEGGRLETENGVVLADVVVFASHYPFINMPGYYFMRMYQERSYVLALEQAASLDGMYYGIDPVMQYSFRNAEGLLLLGGGGHRTGENASGGRYDGLRQKAKEFYPDSRERYHWSAQDCIPLDGMPYIGEFAQSTPDWYAATGFQKWGMTSAMVSAMLFAGKIGARDQEEEAFLHICQLFSPSRHSLEASAKKFWEQGYHAAKDLSKRVFTSPEQLLDELKEGHGGVVEVDSEKVGAYKEDGKVYLVSVKCPHMGCQLEWNSDEKSWDCPCHGSRFDFRGKLLDGPAQTSLDLDIKRIYNMEKQE